MNKDIKKILGVLAIFSLAGAFMYSYQEMWLLSNGLSVSTISTIFAIASFITISVLYICSALVRRDKLKTFIEGLLLSKVVTSLILFFYYKTNFLMLIKFITIVEFVLDVEIFVSIYPLMTYINKNNKEFALRDIIYDACYFGGGLICLILLKYGFYGIQVSYNTYVLIASFLYLVGFLFLRSIDIEGKKLNEKHQITSYGKLIPVLRKDKTSIYYLLFHLFSNISYYSISGTIMILLVEGLGVKVTTSSLILIIFGLMSAVLGHFTLSKHFKNDKVNVGIKYIGRCILYFLAFLSGNRIIIILAVIFCKLTVDSFIQMSDAPFTNRLDNKYQFSFSNFRNSVGYLGRSIGTLICGLLIVIDARLNFLSAFIFVFISIVFIFMAMNGIEKEKHN